MHNPLGWDHRPLYEPWLILVVNLHAIVNRSAAAASPKLHPLSPERRSLLPCSCSHKTINLNKAEKWQAREYVAVLAEKGDDKIKYMCLPNNSILNEALSLPNSSGRSDQRSVLFSWCSQLFPKKENIDEKEKSKENYLPENRTPDLQETKNLTRVP